jgi:transposase
MLFGEKSQLPVFQTTYSGSLKDVSTLKSTLQIASGLKLNNISIVMDKGFCSKSNIDDMLADEDGIRFLISTPLTMSFTKNQISSEKKDIDSVDNTIVIGEDIIRGVAKCRSWHGGHMLYTHVYNNAELAYQARNRLYGLVAKLKREAEVNPTNPKLLTDYEKYLIIRKSADNSTGYTINIRYDVIEEQLQYTGWLIIVSNHITDAVEAINIYRSKDVVEKGFMKLKNCLDLGRLRVHSDLRMQNKIFVGFVALIIMAHIHKVMAANDMHKSYTISKMLKTLERLRVQYVNNDRIVFPLTAEHKYIFNVFGVAPPM